LPEKNAHYWKGAKVKSKKKQQPKKSVSETTSDSVIDFAGFRHNVAIVVINNAQQVLFAKRRGMEAWQFPQGGIHPGESTDNAMYRELREEIGLTHQDVKIIGRSRGWLRYRLPHRMRRGSSPVCIGQKQIWYLLQLTSSDAAIRLDQCEPPEFDGWAWVSYWYPLTQIVDFKREVYAKGLRELLQAYAVALQ